MNEKDEYPSWLIWISERGLVGFLAVLTVLVIVLFSAGYYLDQRLEHIEGRLGNLPPAEYQEPDWDSYAKVPSETLAPANLAMHQAVYVPVYSHVYYRGGRPYLLETTLSIRNVNVDKPIYLKSIEYFNTQGKLEKTQLNHPIRMAPLETIELLVAQDDTSGGSGANFIVQWCATEEVDEPIIEAVMVGTMGTQGISVRASGKVLTEHEFSTVTR